MTGEPDLMVTCLCGNVYSLHTHTVCPECFRWPERKTAAEAIGEYNAKKKRGIPSPCPHDRLNEDGICRACGQDCRGIHS